MILRFALATLLTQSASVTVDLWNDLAGDITVTAPGAAPSKISRYKEASFTALGDASQLTIGVKGCDYVLVLPGKLNAFRDGDDGPVRLYLSDAMDIYVVPPDLTLQTPPSFLAPQQPNQFPVHPGKPTCTSP